jgi:ribose transport system substrate-binding protein
MSRGRVRVPGGGARLTGTLVLALSAAVTVGCGSSSSSSNGAASGGGSSSSSKALRIELLTTFNGLPFYTAMLCGAQDAAKKLGGDITIKSEGPPHGESVPEQLPILQSAVNSQPDGIMLVPADPRALVPAVQTAVNKGIPLVTQDQTLTKHVDLANFRTDNVAGGKLGAEALIKQLKGATGTVLVLDNKPGLPVTNLRAQGFTSAIKAHGGLTLLPTQYNQDDQNKAANEVQAAMRAHPDLVGIFATTEAGALGAASALQGGAKNSHVKVVAYDPDPVLVRALRQGVIDAAVAQGSYYEGYDALTTLVKHIRGKLPKGQIKYDNVVPNKIVTKANLDDPSIKPFLYPTKCT